MDPGEILATLESDIDDLTVWQIYADALSTVGDPRGELIALGFAEQTEGVQERIAELRAARLDHGKGWPEADCAIEGLTNDSSGHFEVDWRYGFADRARVVQPWQQPQLGADMLGTLLAAPCARFLRALSIDREESGDVSMGELGERGIFEWAAPILEQTAIPHLRELEIGSPSDDAHLSQTSDAMMTSAPRSDPEARISRPMCFVGDLTPTLAKQRMLSSLRIYGECVRIDTLPAGQLETLRVQTHFLRASTLETLAATRFPSLSTMELWLGHWPDSVVEFRGPEGEAFFGGATDASMLEPLLAATDVPKLRSLALSNCAWMPEVVDALATSPLLMQLETLDLSYGFMDDDGAQSLFESSDRFAHLRTLDLRCNQLSDKALQRLRDLLDIDTLRADPQNDLEGSAALRVLSW